MWKMTQGRGTGRAGRREDKRDRIRKEYCGEAAGEELYLARDRHHYAPVRARIFVDSWQRMTTVTSMEWAKAEWQGAPQWPFGNKCGWEGKGVRRGYFDSRTTPCDTGLYITLYIGGKRREMGHGMCVEWNGRSTRLGAVLLPPTSLNDETAATTRVLPQSYKKEKRRVLLCLCE